jgi:hypothetical protein
MGIAHAACDLYGWPWVLCWGKGLLDGQPILTEALHKFHTHRHPTVETFDDQTTEHRIFLQQSCAMYRLREAVDETLKALFGGVAWQQALHTGHVDLEDHSPQHHPQQLAWEVLIEQSFQRRWIAWSVRVFVQNSVEQCGQTTPCLLDEWAKGR